MNPCKYCTDWFCCRHMCKAKKEHLDFIEGAIKTYRIRPSRRKIIVTVNKNGIRREEYR